MISLMVAMDANRLIGKDNKLPWHYKEDLQYFKATTMGKDLLMGRKTFDSITGYNNGNPLPGRKHFVATRNAQMFSQNTEQVTYISDINQFLAEYPEDKEMFLIGGAELYERLLDQVDRLYITHIKGEYEGDAWFPEVDFSQFRVVKKEALEKLEFVVYERVRRG